MVGNQRKRRRFQGEESYDFEIKKKIGGLRQGLDQVLGLPQEDPIKTRVPGRIRPMASLADSFFST